METFTVILFDRRTFKICVDCAVAYHTRGDAGQVAIDRAVDRADGHRMPQDFDVLAVFEGRHVPLDFAPCALEFYHGALVSVVGDDMNLTQTIDRAKRALDR